MHQMLYIVVAMGQKYNTCSRQRTGSVVSTGEQTLEGTPASIVN